MLHAPRHHSRLWMTGRVWLLAGLLTGCQLLTPGPQRAAAVEARAETRDVSLLLSASKKVYAHGEPLDLTLEVVNHGPRPVTLRFNTAQRYDILIYNAQGQEVWRWSAERMFAQMLGTETLLPQGGKLTYRVVRHETLDRGAYTVMGVVPAVETPLSAHLELTIQ